MKKFLTSLCWPILKHFETGEAAPDYKKSHRVILIIVGGLFVSLSLGSAIAALLSNELAALVPVVVFFSVGLVALVIGALGSNAAVSKIWGSG